MIREYKLSELLGNDFFTNRKAINYKPYMYPELLEACSTPAKSLKVTRVKRNKTRARIARKTRKVNRK